MRKLVMIGAVALSFCLVAADIVSARGCGGGCRGGRGGRGHRDRGCHRGQGCGHGGHHCHAPVCHGGFCGVTSHGHHHAYVTTTPGYLVVNLPENARLTVDGTATTSTSAQRTFQTPPLQNGRTYSYTLRAEVDRDGVTSAVTHTVSVRAGQTTRVSLDIPASGVASR